MKRYRQTGFNLLELMVTITVFAILLGVGIPSFMETMRANRLTTVVNQLVTALNIARSEAAKRGYGVSVCASNAAHTCALSVSWDTGGWIVFTDDTSTGGVAGAFDVGTDAVLQVYDPPPAGFTVTPTNPAALTYLRYLPNGRPESGLLATTFQVSRPDCPGKPGRLVTVSGAGRVSSDADTC
jgi:type IV fimbrial biogenesis protein FimT